MVSKITAEQLVNWLGSDVERKDLIELIHELANGFYSPEQLRKDVISYIDEED